MRRASLMLILLTLLVSLFILSVFSNILAGYPERLHEDRERQKEGDTGKYAEEHPSVLLFKVSPVTPRLFWRTWSADYYTGLHWLRTTDEKALKEFPQFQDTNATRVFTVEVNMSQREIFLPLASPNSTLANVSSATSEGLRFYMDTIGNVFKVGSLGQAEKTQLVYKVSWSESEVDDSFTSLDNIPEEILSKYLQLPNISTKVWKLAKDLEDPSYSVLDQILADVQYLRTNFVYDESAYARYLYEQTVQGSDVSFYIEQGKGVCFDAATALAVILRIQRIPSRISIGYKPERTEGNKLLYYTSGEHAVTEVYLPSYGWIQFDATPPLEEDPLVKVLPFKRESSPGSRLFYQLSLTNRRNSTDHFTLFAYSEQKWNIKAAPEELRVEAHQTTDALLEVAIPDGAGEGEKDLVTLTVTSMSTREFSIVVITQVENTTHIVTKTTLKDLDEAVVRGNTFWVNGTVVTDSDELVDNMTVFIFLTKSTKGKGVIVGKGHSEQDGFEIKCRTFYFMEIGDYKVVPISLGTTQYAPSSSDSIIRVHATTRIELGSEEEFLLGYGAIHGRLLWDDGTGFANAPISFKVTSIAIPSEFRRLQNLTLSDGSFKIGTMFENSGEYEVEATFLGNEYILGSSVTRIINLKRGLPAIQISGEDIAIRGEVFDINGTVRFEDIGVRGESVTVAFDNKLLETIETRRNGSYTWSFPVDSRERLGPHFLTVSLKKGNVSAIHKIDVKSKTTLTSKVSEVVGGVFLLFSVSLSDDQGLPIQGAEIIVDNYGLLWKTDKNGNLTFLLDTVKLWPENLVLFARFEGSELYLPVASEKEVVFNPVISIPFLVPLVSPISLVLVCSYIRHHAARRQKFRRTGDMEVIGEIAIEEKELVNRPQKIQPLKIVLPDIDVQFPNVWGVKDELHMEIVLDKSAVERIPKKEVEVLIDEETVTSVRLSQQRRAELSHVFIKKGEHRVQATLLRTSGRQPWNAEVKLRVVDYREEIIELYNRFTERVVGVSISARKKMTAREMESLILRMEDSDLETLRRVTTCFEKAEYSDHLTTREDYETMYLSLKELNIDVEWKD